MASAQLRLRWWGLFDGELAGWARAVVRCLGG
jgi:hypothetical protein